MAKKYKYLFQEYGLCEQDKAILKKRAMKKHGFIFLIPPGDDTGNVIVTTTLFPGRAGGLDLTFAERKLLKEIAKDSNGRIVVEEK